MSESRRRNDVDALRVFATYLLFVFHTAKIFDPAPFYHVRNDELSIVMTVLAGFISLWHMPLFFVLAGWSAYGSVAGRGAGGFVRERLRRLALPLAAGCITIAPVLKYVELKSGLDLSHEGLRVAPELQAGFRTVIPQGLPVAPPFDESFLEFLPTFFTSLDRFTWAHLWFLAYLFVFSVVLTPVFVAIVRARTRSEEVGAAWVYAPAAVLALIQVTLRPYWPGVQNLYDDWANVAYYTTFLLLGFLLAKHPGFARSVVRERRRALVVSVATMLVLLAALLGAFDSPPVLLAGTAVAGWGFIIAMLGYARTYLDRPWRGLDYLGESALPVYILHQPAVVLVGYAVVATSLGIAAKFVLITAGAAAATLLAYHFAVRRSALLRALYGMKAAGSRPAAWRPAIAALLIATAIAAGAAGLPAREAESGVEPRDERSASPLGSWWAERGAARVEVTDCDGALCGRVAWLRSPLGEDGCALRDEHNPRRELRGRAVTGLEVLSGLRPAGLREWSGGLIYDPGAGKTYRVALKLEDDDVLELRGYVGVPLLGRTVRWRRVGSEDARCGAADAKAGSAIGHDLTEGHEQSAYPAGTRGQR